MHAMITFIYLLASAALVSAMRFPVTATTATNDRPDTTSASMVTELPNYLKRRAQKVIGYEALGSICGYLNGEAGAIQSCPDKDSQCAVVFDPAGDEDGTIACCNFSGQPNSCVFTDTCVDSVQYYNTNVCDNDCKLDINTMKCTDSDLPYCYPQVYTRWSATGYTCHSISFNTSDTINPPEFSTTFVGQRDYTPWTPIFNTANNPFIRRITDDGVTATETDVESMVTTSDATSRTAEGAASTSASENPSPTTTGNHTGRTLAAGAIIGAALGAAALLGIFALLATCLCLRERRRRPNHDMPNPPTVPMSPVQSPHSPSPGGEREDMRRLYLGVDQSPRVELPDRRNPLATTELEGEIPHELK